MAECRGIANIDFVELDVANNLIEVREAASGKVVDDPDVMSGGEQTADDMRADESGSARD
jgi:hypothetical protein